MIDRSDVNGNTSQDATPKASTPAQPPFPNGEGRRKRERRSRWGDETKKVNIPGMPTSLPKLNQQQADNYVCKYENCVNQVNGLLI